MTLGTGTTATSAIQKLAAEMEHLSHAHGVLHEARARVLATISEAKAHGLLPGDVVAGLEREVARTYVDATDATKRAADRIIAVLSNGPADAEHIANKTGLLLATIKPLLARMESANAVQSGVTKSAGIVYRLPPESK